MTRKESGWVSEALRLADEYAGAEYLSEAGAAYVRLRDFIDAKDASTTSLQSAAEGLEEALKEMRIDMKIAQGNMRHAAKRDPNWEGCAETLQHRVDQADAALAAWRNIAEFKEK